MFKKIMNKTILGIAASIFLMAQGAFAFEVKGESFPANFNITSWTAGNGESTITSEGVVGEGYGKVYLTHHFTVSSDDGMSGDSLVKPELLIKMESYNMLLYKVRGVEMEKL